MRKYWAFWRASIQTTLTYRGPIVIWLLNSLVSTGMIILVWLSASAGSQIGGYSKPELITYYVAGLFLHWLNGWFPFYDVSDQIRSGRIVVGALSKPHSFYWSTFFEELGWHTVSVWVGLLASLFLSLFWGQYLVFHLGQTNLLGLILAIGLSIGVTYGFSLCMGLLAFWFTTIDAFESFFWICRSILGGTAIPLSFVPETFQLVVRVLPFRYMFSFPLEVYLGKLSTGGLLFGLGMQLVWSVGLFGLYRLMWQKGRRIYTAFGQ
jgi:ABC-2 type transport system permease protein